MQNTAIKLDERRKQFIKENSQSWKVVGENLKKLRLKEGLSLEKCASNISVSATTLSKLERGLPVEKSGLLEKAYELYLKNVELSRIKDTVDKGKYLTTRNLSGYINDLNRYIHKEREKINKITETLKLIYGDKFVSIELIDYPSLIEDSETEQVAISSYCEAIINIHSEETQKYDHPLQICYEFSNPITDISKELQSILEEIKVTIESDNTWNSEYYKERAEECK